MVGITGLSFIFIVILKKPFKISEFLNIKLKLNVLETHGPISYYAIPKW